MYGVARLRFVGTGVLRVGSDFGVLDLGVWVCGLDSLETNQKRDKTTGVINSTAWL